MLFDDIEEKEEEKDTDENQEKELIRASYDQDRFRHSLTGIWTMIMALAYVIVGGLANIWHPTWVMFISVPLFDTLVSAIQKRKVAEFAYPILVVIAYLLIGFLITGWHPYWFLFLTIPVFYVIAHEIDSQCHR